MEVALEVVANTTSPAIVHIVGGQTYLNECSNNGIAIPANRNVTVEGIGGGTNDMPIIDCQSKGRLFVFSDAIISAKTSFSLPAIVNTRSADTIISATSVNFEAGNLRVSISRTHFLFELCCCCFARRVLLQMILVIHFVPKLMQG